MSVLLGILLFHPWPLLVGYWLGAMMHLTFDVLVNGDCALRRPVLFYFFSYRFRYRFAAKHLVDVVIPEVSCRPIRDFFRWRPLEVIDQSALHENPEVTG
jgi:hypothetical protein